jgi:hypothetical protein
MGNYYLGLVYLSQAVRRLWPKEDFLASSRCKVSHEGLVDAARDAVKMKSFGLSFMNRELDRKNSEE